MESTKDGDLAEIHEKVEILSTDDEKIKLIGSLLSNDASRSILKLLFEQEMTANDIAKKTGMLLSLVIFHLQKMQESGIVTISKIGKNSKGHDMKYYGTTKLAVIILPSKFSDKAKNSKSLNNSLNKIFRFTAIGIAGLVSWLIAKSTIFPITEWNTGQEIPITTVDQFLSIIIGLSVIIIGMMIERAITALKK
ncbi:MAG: winged helix-turn-helix domain-containing protein [Candidatus Nitrosotenuis sp.]